MIHSMTFLLINPRRACAARVTVVGLCVCVSVCLLSHISPLERLFVLKTLSRTQRATKVKKFVGFSLKPLRCRDPALPALYGYALTIKCRRLSKPNMGNTAINSVATELSHVYACVRMRAYVALSRSLSYIAYKKRALRPVVHSERC